MATHSSILAWRIPMDRGAWGGYSSWGHKESDTAEHKQAHGSFYSERSLQPTVEGMHALAGLRTRVTEPGHSI